MPCHVRIPSKGHVRYLVLRRGLLEPVGQRRQQGLVSWALKQRNHGLVALERRVPQFKCEVEYSSQLLTKRHRLCVGALRLRGGVLASLADGGQHFGCDPFLESLGLGLAAGQDQAVQAGFVDDGNAAALCRSVGADVGNADISFFVIIKAGDRIAVVTDCQGFAHVSSDEPRFAVACKGAEGLRIKVENGKFGHFGS